MKKYIALPLALASVIGVAACGSTSVHTKTVTVASKAPTPPATTADPQGSQPVTPTTTTPSEACADNTDNPCNPGAGSTDPTTDPSTDSTTTADGSGDTSGDGSGDTSTTTAPTNTANAGGTLKLDSLSAKVVGVRIEHQLSSDMGVKTAKGKFVIVTLAVTNKAHSPQSWGSNQSALVAANGDNYSEDFDVENGVDQNSLLWTASGNLNGSAQPGQTVTGDVVFDVPSNVRVSGGSIGIVNFGDDTSYLDQASQVGEIALGNLD